MASFLVDTQVFIWLTNNNKNIGAGTLQMLTDGSNRVYISYFSFFEMAIKASIGKLTYDPSVISDLPRMGIEMIMPDEAALQGYAVFNPSNKDPFDNMLISVARNEKATLVTSDPKILTVSISGFKSLDVTK